ncbi:MAG: hypothetical protein KDA77_22070, partial [Planctomycetaceae bacterium]|nr:hypothetical protein [Planctomycetaceae bacterium]
MSNVAIKLIAVTGVVGLGVLMFLQAQKGIQSGSIENQIGQLEVLESESQTATSPDSQIVPDQTKSESGEIKIPRSQVPAELSELAARNAAPIESQSEPLPFAPNTTSAASKIKLTAATGEPVSDNQNANEFEPAEQNAFNTPAKGLDFREPPEMKTPELNENPFGSSVKPAAAETQKPETLSQFESDPKTGPQFGPAAKSDTTPFPEDAKTSIPPREAFSREPGPASPFEQESVPGKPALSPEPEQPAANSTPV